MQTEKAVDDIMYVDFPRYVSQMYITSNPYVYFFVRGFRMDDPRFYGATIAGVILLCIFLEGINFLKWFMSARKRITANSLASLVQINKTDVEKKVESKKFRLKPLERVLIIIL